MADYKKEAQEEIDAQWNAKRTALINENLGNKTLLSNQKAGINAGYDAQITDTNKAYDTQVDNQNLNNKLSKNNLSNSALGRGISRSSIILSQLGESDQINNRVVNSINTDRTSTLNNISSKRNADLSSIDNNIAMYDIQLNRNLADLDSSKMAEVNTLARALEDRALSMARSSGSGSSGSSGSRSSGSSASSKSKGNNITQIGWQEFQNQLTNGTGGAWLQLNEKDLKSDMGTTEYNKMRATYDAYLEKLKAQQATARGSAKQEFLDKSQGYSLRNQ